ncbi:hypothetical protein LCGC14_0586650, partial [marine sediment metagenome]
MKVHKPDTADGFFLVLKRIVEDIESEKIREYQKEHLL